MTNLASTLLREASLIVSGDKIESRPTKFGNAFEAIDPWLNGDFDNATREEIATSFIESFLATVAPDTPQPAEFADVVSRVEGVDFTDAIFRLLAESSLKSGGRGISVAGAGRLHKSAQHKGGQHKGAQHKGAQHKGAQHKGATLAAGATAGAPVLEWPEILPPWAELKKLYDLREKYRWENYDDDGFLDKPRSPKHQQYETLDLLKKQSVLRRADNAWRRGRIEIEASNDLTAYMAPLGTDVTAPGTQTAVLFQKVLWLGNVIGLYYKARFAAPRPHVVNPNIEPYLPVPAFYSYPSNHAFQSYLIAEVFARAVPEHPGLLALFRAAGEVAVNREYAGLHFRSDTKAGQKLARLCAPMMEHVLEEQILLVRQEWY